MSEPTTLPQYTTAAMADICKEFLSGFRKNGVQYYDERIQEMGTLGKTVLTINYDDVIGVGYEMDQAKREALLDMLNLKTEEFLESCKEAVISILGDKNKFQFIEENSQRLRVKLNDTLHTLEIPQIGVDFIDEFISTEGIISVIDGNVRTLYKKLIYACVDKEECGHTFEVASNGLSHRPLRKCPDCSAPVEIDYKESKKYAVNYKRGELQPLPERSQPDRADSSIEFWLIGDDLTEKAIPADRVKMTGFLRTVPKAEMRNSLADFVLETNYLKSLNNVEMDNKDSFVKKLDVIKAGLTEENEDEFFNKAVNSIAPSVTGDNYRIIKMSLYLMLVGAPARIKPDGGRIRGDINVLLAGVPGSAKSDLGKWVEAHFPRVVYATNMSSKVGLTGMVDVGKGGEPSRIRPGAYMFANGGGVVCDELDKLLPDDLNALPNIMDDGQILAINKGGISKKFPVRTFSLHICNPEGGKWNNEKSLGENLPNFAFWLFDRYDAKWIFRSIKDEATNAKISNHIIDSLFNSISEKDFTAGLKKPVLVGDYFEGDMMRELFIYCRKKFNPEPQVSGATATKITEMADKMHKFFMSLKMGKHTEDITFREINIIFRWALASARGHMRDYLTMKDFDIALAIITESMRSCGINPETGEVDMRGYLGQELPKAEVTDREKRKQGKKFLKEIIRRLSVNCKMYVYKTELKTEMFKVMPDNGVIAAVIAEFEKLGVLYEAPGMPDSWAVLADRFNAMSV